MALRCCAPASFPTPTPDRCYFALTPSNTRLRPSLDNEAGVPDLQPGSTQAGDGSMLEGAPSIVSHCFAASSVHRQPQLPSAGLVMIAPLATVTAL
ncbi:hypothetical protein CIB48_g8128 [Xylaria polymorpha]|nr:hypothetical protein CIB48_g8128 [Xylaria polymorpha]